MTTVDITAESSEKVIYGNNATYSTARSNSTGTDTAFIRIGQLRAPASYYVYRCFFEFDTSSIPDNAIISKVNLKLTCLDDRSTLAEFDAQIVEQNWSGTQEVDYDDCLSASTSFLWKNTGGMSEDTTYTSADLTTSYINKTGTTKYSLRSSRDKNADSPPSVGSEYIDFYLYNDATVAYRPTLTVEYSLPPPSQFFFFFQ